VAIAFGVRMLFADQQSPYMDEGTNVITGRMLLEQNRVYAEVLNWAYGSYLWPLIAGVADQHGGFVMVRAVTALCGAIMALATSLATYRLAPASVSKFSRERVALLAGFAMALAPTAIGVGRFGTYDGLAGAGFMLGVAIAVPAEGRLRPLRLFLAAALLFVAFLSKYLVAVYFPLICLYLMLAPLVRSPRRPAMALTNTLYLVIPLTAACAGYLLYFLGPLVTLFMSSLHYGDLASADPLRIYLWTRPELWVLVGLAVLGWRLASGTGRLVGLVGFGVIMAFQFKSRPDFDFWKHSIYVIFFLAPIAALAWLRAPRTTGTWKVVVVAVPAAVAIGLLPRAELAASHETNFYPNLQPSLDAIEKYTAGSAELLMDDTALRYYLYGKMPLDGQIGPFMFSYGGGEGIPAYRSAIRDHWFDTIVLDGGVTPQGAAMRAELGQDIADNYDRVFSAPAGTGFRLDIYKLPSARSDTFQSRMPSDSGVGDWAAHPEGGESQPGLSVSSTTEQVWEGHPSLKFTVNPGVFSVGTRIDSSVRTARAQVFVIAADGGTQPVRVGLYGFDNGWLWRDDGYRWLVTPGQWTTVTWNLSRPGPYHELGLTFPTGVATAYIGDLEIAP